MAQWKETLEPYVKVYETVKSSALNPSAGGELIIGCALISDAGPSVPTLITSQSEFLSTYSSADLTKEYVAGLDKLYLGDNKTTASTMWMNAYRLAGSNSILCVRACKATNIFYAKPLTKSVDDDNLTFILRDGELLKGISSKPSIEISEAGSDSVAKYGWYINIDGVGKFGNAVDDNGPIYDYYVDNLVDLVDKLNETTKFFSPEYKYYANEDEVLLGDSTDLSTITKVVFDEVYVGNNIVVAKNNTLDAVNLSVSAGINETFDAPESYATNVFNSASELKVRIRRFNHDAAVQKTINDATLTANGSSPWVVLPDVLETYYNSDGTHKGSAVSDRDFYEVAIMDPSISSEPLYFNIGKILGRGDMEASEVNENLKMIQLVLPDNMLDLELEYYGRAKEGSDTKEQIWADLTINPDNTKILSVSDSDLKKALDLISLDEVYVTEGLCDLGNTELSFQNYMANMAINENYFYPISTVNSTNYMTIANNATKISQDSYKLYMSAPWDIDSGTLGWKTYMSPSVLYWEAVARNRRNNEEFRGILGQSGGIVQYQKPLVEFNKKTRQLLLSRKINTVLWNIQTSAWNMNDNFTKQSVENIMSDDGNSRLAIRISKAMPLLLRQFIGRKITSKLWDDAKGVLNYWFRSTIMSMQYTVAEYAVIIDETNNPQELQRQNKMAVTVNVRYLNSLKYITVYHNILELGMDVNAA